MKKILTAVFGVVLATTMLTPAFAEVKNHKINKHQHQQKARIAEGVKSGELTRDEAKELRADQREIRQKEHEYKSDGKFTKEERQEIRQEQREASKEIHEEKHDGEKRKGKKHH